MEHVKHLAEDRRRLLQQEAGLVVIQRKPPTTERNRNTMDLNQTATPGARPSRAQATLERLTEPPSFTEVAAHELKRAAVWMPMLFSAGATLLWMNKRFFLPKVG